MKWLNSLAFIIEKIFEYIEEVERNHHKRYVDEKLKNIENLDEKSANDLLNELWKS